MFTVGPPFWKGAPSGADPFFANVVLLCHCDGTNGSTTFLNVVAPLGRGGPLLSAGTGNPTVSTTAPLFGTGCANFPSANGAITAIAAADYAYPGDFTVEFAMKTALPLQTTLLFDQRNSEPQIEPAIYMFGGQFFYYVNGANQIGGAGTVATSTWQRVAYSKNGTTGRLFVEGTQLGSFTDNFNYAASTMFFGLEFGSSNGFIGQMDELRVTEGVGRYTANYTPATAAFPDF